MFAIIEYAAAICSVVTPCVKPPSANDKLESFFCLFSIDFTNDVIPTYLAKSFALSGPISDIILHDTTFEETSIAFLTVHGPAYVLVDFGS